MKNSTEDFALVIHNVVFNDSGWYTCTPYNENGPGVQSDLMTVAALGKALANLTGGCYGGGDEGSLLW